MGFKSVFTAIVDALTPQDRTMESHSYDKYEDRLEVTWRNADGTVTHATYVNQTRLEQAVETQPRPRSTRPQRCSAHTHVSHCEDRNCIFHANAPASDRPLAR